jgi:cellulose synthase/poly-beta-1,6-N-acetylglucosamine synthase-like glycosyltransferase
MVFDGEVLRSHGWVGETLTEDREYGYELLLRGIRVRYVPEARSHGQAAGSWREAEPQRLRWYGGVVAMQRRLAGRLLASAFRQRSLALFDAAVELLMPSYSFLTAISLANLVLVMGLQGLLPGIVAPLGIVGSAVLLAGWLSYPMVGLVIDRAPAWAYGTLLLGPLYLMWRLWISTQVRLRGERIAWIRTQRREETDGAVS